MKLLRFFEFILENKEEILLPMAFSREFSSRLRELNSMDSSIAKKLYTDYVKYALFKYSFISLGKSSDTIEYTDSSKLFDYLKNSFSKYIQHSFSASNQIENIKKIITDHSFPVDHEIWSKNRTEMKIGRFIKKIYGDTFNDSEIENFVNQWKSKDTNIETNFEIWKGNKIKEGYFTENYSPTISNSNPLINSCMNSRIDLIEFYTQCEVNLLVLLDRSNLVLGRALVWTDDKGNIIMDRIYYAFDKDYYKFIQYAKDNGWYYKKRNISGESKFMKDGSEIDLDTKVKVPFPDKYNEKSRRIPYMDTFRYVKGQWAMNKKPELPYLLLIDTNGDFARIYTKENEDYFGI